MYLRGVIVISHFPENLWRKEHNPEQLFVMYRRIILPVRKKKYNIISLNHFFNFRIYCTLLLLYHTQDTNYEQPRSHYKSPPRRLEATTTIVKPSYASETILKPSNASGTIVKDVWWDQDDPNVKNIQQGAIGDDPGDWRMIRAELQGLERFND